eukprot:757991-Hanusia_phi.AAC.1
MQEKHRNASGWQPTRTSWVARNDETRMDEEGEEEYCLSVAITSANDLVIGKSSHGRPVVKHAPKDSQLRAGDVLERIDERDVRGLSSEELQQALREIKSMVKMTVMRKKTGAEWGSQKVSEWDDIDEPIIAICRGIARRFSDLRQSKFGWILNISMDAMFAVISIGYSILNSTICWLILVISPHLGEKVEHSYDDRFRSLTSAASE